MQPHATPETFPARAAGPAGLSGLDADALGRRLVWIYIAWMTTYVIEGPLRGGLSTVGLPNLLYVRDLVALISIATAMAVPLLHREKLPPGLALVCWLLAVHLCVGLLLGGHVFQRLFGVKIFIPLLYAVAIYPAVARHFRLFVGAMAVFFVVSVLGVFVNFFIGEWPWEGLNYDTAFGAVSTTRTWWIGGGIRRLPGLARASFDAAMVIGLSGVVLLALLRSVWWRVLVALAGMAAIVLTTSKGMVLAFGIAALWQVLFGQSDTAHRLGKWLAAALLFVTCLVPSIFIVVSVSESPTEIPILLSSLWDRFSWMWPSAYALLPDFYGALTGVGPGGIGTALNYPDPLAVPNSADSIFVYFFVTFGLLGLLYLAFPLTLIRKADPDDRTRDLAWMGLLIIAFGYGLSINMVEQPFFCSIFGLLYGVAFARWSK